MVAIQLQYEKIHANTTHSKCARSLATWYEKHNFKKMYCTKSEDIFSNSLLVTII